MIHIFEKFFPESIQPYVGRILMTLAGFVIAVLFLTLGFWRTLLIAALAAAGYLLGKWEDGALAIRGRYHTNN